MPLEQVLGSEIDAVVVGAGHNGLVAALVLAKAGQRVVVLERASVIGGATRTEYPFARAPNLPQSTGAYLLGLMPPELERLLGIDIPTLRRDPHYFLPTTGERHLLFGSDRADVERGLRRFFSEQDLRAHRALEAELGLLREDVGPTWLEDPSSIEETAERFVRRELREPFVRLCRGSVGEYLERFDFASDLLKAMYAVTDGISGLYGGYDTPGSGMNFLIHNMCRRPGSDGTWMVVQGGMGTVPAILARELERHGGRIVTDAPVSELVVRDSRVQGVRLTDGRELKAASVIVNADPFTMLDLVPEREWPADYVTRVRAMARPGSTLKLNLALERMPRFRCLPELPPAFGPTIHLLPEEAGVLDALREAFDAARSGRLPDFPSIEWYIHSTVDPTLTDERGRLSSALFVQWVPYEIAGSSWEAEGERYARHLLSLCDRFAPGTSELVADWQILPPPAIEAHFGIRGGHIHHVDNSFGFADRLPHATPIGGLYSASAGTHPAGSVIGCAGYLAARRCLRDRGLWA
ncbi:MAG TPA: NAD(P)/FAD-dependent oxidoreductase [Polyangiaceae bacterium]|nr:NAD(P)/FAD-dependent oxidoreductase [Polyangiaceae bacterium]